MEVSVKSIDNLQKIPIAIDDIKCEPDEYPENISDESDPFTQLIFYASVEQGQNGEKEKKPTPTNISIALAEALISTEEIPIDAIKHELDDDEYSRTDPLKFELCENNDTIQLESARDIELHAVDLHDTPVDLPERIITNVDDSLPEQRVYACDQCDKTFASANCFLVHQRNIHQNNHKRHEQRAHEEIRPYICRECGKSFAESNDLKRHSFGHIGERSFVCSYGSCNSTFSHPYALDRHQKAVHLNKRKTIENPSVIETKLYACDQCDKRFACARNYLDHQRNVHQGVHEFSCKICGKGFNTSLHLESHEFIHSGERPYACSYDSCDWTFSTKSNLKKHEQRAHEGIRPYICRECGKSFAESNELKIHLFGHIRERPYVCSYSSCNSRFSHPYALNKHQKTAHLKKQKKVENFSLVVQKPYTCDQCDKEFACAKNYLVHQRNFHQGIHKFSCKVCGKGFNASLHLKNHTNTHTGERPYECDSCGLAFSTKSSLERHKKTAHREGNTGQRSYACDLCNSNFTDLFALRWHKRTVHLKKRKIEDAIKHELDEKNCSGNDPLKFELFVNNDVMEMEDAGDIESHAVDLYDTSVDVQKQKNSDVNDSLPKQSKYACDQCDKTFVSAKTVLVHRRTIHQNNYRLSCKFCGKGFNASLHLESHEFTHTGERPYACSYESCDWLFSKKSTLKRHEQRAHEGIRPHICKECGKGFFESFELKKHAYQHTGEGPFDCELCDSKFSDPISLKRHKNKVHLRKQKKIENSSLTEQKKYHCDQCDKTFVTTRNYLAHQRNAHQRKKAIHPYICKYCGKGFNASLHLENHTNTHTGERPYDCDSCNWAFSTKSSLERHKKIAHRTNSGIRTFTCNVCKQSYSTAFLRKIHACIGN